jgi:hypothetical protein
MATNENHSLESVRIRMYRQGLGDCFLLTFTNARGEKYNMLVDCGVLGGAKKRIAEAVKDIMDQTGQRIDVLVATHEHSDHISGFKTSAASFEEAQIDQVWLAWTEDLSDQQAKKFREKDNALQLGITASMMGMEEDQIQSIQQILEFYTIESEDDDDQEESPNDGGDLSNSAFALGGKEPFMFAKTMDATMKKIREWGGENVKYLEPGDIQSIPDFGVKFHILGPSRKMKMLGGTGPEEAEPGHGFKISQASSFMAAAFKAAGAGTRELSQVGWSQADIDEWESLSMPFDGSLGLALDEVKKTIKEQSEAQSEIKDPYLAFYKDVYGLGSIPPSNRDEMLGPDWRRIDIDWLMAGGSLALQQVSNINNTSLVMAIELPAGQVLLFVGDAEEHNWDLWDEEIADLEELLANTVVYKVGHHGSHNATDKALVKQMTNRDLVALIPVDKERSDKNRGWVFPAEDLYFAEDLETPDDLSKKAPNQRGLLDVQTKGRVIVNCGKKSYQVDPIYNPSPETPWPGVITPDPSGEKLWIDYTLTF